MEAPYKTGKVGGSWNGAPVEKSSGVTPDRGAQGKMTAEGYYVFGEKAKNVDDNSSTRISYTPQGAQGNSSQPNDPAH